MRLATLGSKFVMVFMLARLLEPEAFGLYGLLTATVSYALYAVGLDFYTYSTRELLKQPKSQWGQLLKSQGALTTILYGLLGPVLLLVFAFDLLPWHFAAWFFVLLVLEHINQEMDRLLVAISRPLTASVVLFVRSGLWALLAVAYMAVEPSQRTLEFVFAAWAAGGVVGLLISAHALRQEHIGGWRLNIDWPWLKKGIAITLPFLLATLALRGIYTADRYWFEALNGLHTLGAYVLFVGMCNALVSFLDAGVFAFAYPQLITAHHQGQEDAFIKKMHHMLLQTTMFTAVFALLAWLALPWVLAWINKPAYLAQQSIFVWLLLGTSLFALSMVPHYGLYARGQDKHIIASHMFGLLVFAGVAFALEGYTALFAVPLAMCAAFATLLIWKTGVYLRGPVPVP